MAALAVRVNPRDGRAPGRPLELYSKTVTAMGTFVTASLWSSDEADAARRIDAALDRVAAVERLMSRFDPSSDVSRVNAAPPATPVPVSPETIRVLEIALDVSRRTGGAFDVTVGPLVALWREAARAGRMPSDEEIAAARALVGSSALVVDRAAGSVTLARAGATLDLSAVAKGYAAAEALRALSAPDPPDGSGAAPPPADFVGGFVNAGGDIAFAGANPDGAPWRVGTADPRYDSRILGALHIVDAAVVTSGDYEQFYLIAGRRYSHIVDPRSGRALERSVAPASVTVVAADAALADAWATALSVLGRDGAAPAADAGVEFLMVFIVDDHVSPFESPGFARLRAARPDWGGDFEN